jgi:predicted nucleotide-binding protein (sugar kinase/HSP70/actin superfamily)
MAKGDPRIQVICPGCQASLTVDPRTGLVVHAEGKKSDFTFDEALDQLQSRKEKSEELFQKAFQDEEERKQNLEEKFKEALDSKDELDEPNHPLEWD